jgi:hypothetical protein
MDLDIKPPKVEWFRRSQRCSDLSQPQLRKKRKGVAIHAGEKVCYGKDRKAVGVPRRVDGRLVWIVPSSLPLPVTYLKERDMPHKKLIRHFEPRYGASREMVDVEAT